MTYYGNGVDLAIQIASEAHSGQVDKSGDPYILHPLRVMLMQKKEHRRIIAVLHDVVEDTEVTFDELSNHFGDDIITSLMAITRGNKESWEDFIGRCKADEDALYIKISDIADNMSAERMVKLDLATKTRLENKYKKGMEILLK